MREKRREGSEEDLILELIRHPGWLLVEKKLSMMLDGANSRLQNSELKDFERNKGFFMGIKMVNDIVVEDPKRIIDYSGIRKMK